MEGGRPDVRRHRDHHHERRRGRPHAEDEGANPQLAAKGDEAVAEEKEGIPRRHEKHQREVADQRSQTVVGQRVELAQDAGQTEGAKRESQVSDAALSTAEPVDDRGQAECQKAEADDRLHDRQRSGHRYNSTARNSTKATNETSINCHSGAISFSAKQLGFSRPL